MRFSNKNYKKLYFYNNNDIQFCFCYTFISEKERIQDTMFRSSCFFSLGKNIFLKSMPVHTARQFIRPVSALWQGKPMKMKNACRRVLLTRTNWAFPSLSPASKTDALWGRETIPHDARRCMIEVRALHHAG